MWGRAEHGRKTVEGTVTPMKSLCTPIRITKDEKNMSSEQISRTVTQLMKELFQHDMDMRSLKVGNERMQRKRKAQQTSARTSSPVGPASQKYLVNSC